MNEVQKSQYIRPKFPDKERAKQIGCNHEKKKNKLLVFFLATKALFSVR